MQITKETKNELLKRKEISFLIESDKNPSFAEMKKLISEKFSKDEDCVEVYNINGKFGRNTFLVKTLVYDSKDALEKAIQKSRKQRKEEKKALFDAKKAEAEAKKAAAEAKSTEAST
jgi:ribosomal protein S24E